MTRTNIIRALLASSALILSTTAMAQEPEPQPDPSDATADATIAQTKQLDDAQSKIELLQAQVEALQESIAQIQAAQAKSVPSWKGAPELADKDSGFSFKPKGFMQYDAGYVGYPDGDQLRGTVGGINYQNLGWNTRARRLVIGAEGSLPGGFKYKAEFNFAQATVDYEDILLSYDFKDSPLTITAGNFYPYSGLEIATSSRLGSMLERASFTDAFNESRRLGVGLSLADKKADRYTLAAGLFSVPINNSSFTRTGWEAAIRGTYTPPLAGGFIHLGASYQYRVNVKEAEAAQYQSRPLTQITDQRFVNTGNLAAKGDQIVGVEFGGEFKSFHFASEAQKLWVRHAFSPTDVELDPDNNDTIPSGSVRLNGDPSFWGGYFEVGYYFTGESRGYKNGRWDRTKVLHPFDQGGIGAIQLNGRIDYVDLSDRVDGAPSTATALQAVSAPYYVNGGKQLGYQASLIWNPIDYVRFMAQYGHVSVTGGPAAASVDPDSSKSANKIKYGVNTAVVRAQLEF
jgi:phosphate-selective porin OprO/OprP